MSIVLSSKEELLTYNRAGGRAYIQSAELNLAKLACTGFLGDTYYTDASSQVDLLVNLCKGCNPDFIGACAVYSIKKALLKDMPVYLLAILRNMNVEVFKKYFPAVIRDGLSLRKFVALIRSGTLEGSKSLNSSTRNLINNWLDSRHPVQLWNDSIGKANISLGQIFCLSHPNIKKQGPEKEAVYRLIYKNEKSENLPQQIKDYFSFIENKTDVCPANVPYLRLTCKELSTENWTQIALKNMTWNQLRQNLNMLEEKDIFNSEEVVKAVSAKLADTKALAKARVLPFELYTSYNNVYNDKLKEVLSTLIEESVNNIPSFEGNVVIALDISASMSCKVNSKNKNDGFTCAEVAGFLAAGIYKNNPNSRVIPFHSEAQDYTKYLTKENSLVKNMNRLPLNTGRSTNCASPAKFIADNELPCDLFVMLSDNESLTAWENTRYQYRGWGVREEVTNLKAEWDRIKLHSPGAKFVMIDLSVSESVQLPPDAHDTLHISGYTTEMFSIINRWLNKENIDLVKEIRSEYIDA